MNEDQTWMEVVGPLIRKCRLAGLLDMDRVFKPNGALALAELLEQMAVRLDHAVEIVGRPHDKNDKRPYEGESNG